MTGMCHRIKQNPNDFERPCFFREAARQEIDTNSVSPETIIAPYAPITHFPRAFDAKVIAARECLSD